MARSRDRIIITGEKQLIAEMKKIGKAADEILLAAATAGAEIVRAEISAEFDRHRVSGDSADNFVSKPGSINKDGVKNVVVTLRDRGVKIGKFWSKEYPFFLEFGSKKARERGGTLPRFGLIRKAFDRAKKKAAEAVLAEIKKALDL